MATNRAFEIAKKSGFYTCRHCKGIGEIGGWVGGPSGGYDQEMCPTCEGDGIHIETDTLYMFMLAEVSEAHKAVRNHRRANNKFINAFHKDVCRDMLWKVSYKRFLKDTFEMELADIHIMIQSACGYLGIEIDEKQYNIKELGFNMSDDFIHSCLYGISKNIVRSEYHRDRKAFLTDALSIVFSIANTLDIPLKKCIEIKMRYNETRSDLHEGE